MYDFRKSKIYVQSFKQSSGKMIGKLTKLVLKRKKLDMVKPKLALVMHVSIKVKTGH